VLSINATTRSMLVRTSPNSPYALVRQTGKSETFVGVFSESGLRLARYELGIQYLLLTSGIVILSLTIGADTGNRTLI
jgi:hypothetical protein